MINIVDLIKVYAMKIIQKQIIWEVRVATTGLRTTAVKVLIHRFNSSQFWIIWSANLSVFIWILI